MIETAVIAGIIGAAGSAIAMIVKAYFCFAALPHGGSQG